MCYSGSGQPGDHDGHVFCHELMFPAHVYKNDARLNRWVVTVSDCSNGGTPNEVSRQEQGPLHRPFLSAPPSPSSPQCDPQVREIQSKHISKQLVSVNKSECRHISSVRPLPGPPHACACPPTPLPPLVVTVTGKLGSIARVPTKGPPISLTQMEAAEAILVTGISSKWQQHTGK